jgi:hypothetical protein
VGTPDPLLLCPPLGQRLLISWNKCEPSMTLKLTVRFHNSEEAVFSTSIKKSKGTYIYELLGQDYLDKGGILTYKAELLQGNILVCLWKHQLWAERINIEN